MDEVIVQPGQVTDGHFFLIWINRLQMPTIAISGAHLLTAEPGWIIMQKERSAAGKRSALKDGRSDRRSCQEFTDGHFFVVILITRLQTPMITRQSVSTSIVVMCSPPLLEDRRAEAGIMIPRALRRIAMGKTKG